MHSLSLLSSFFPAVRSLPLLANATVDKGESESESELCVLARRRRDKLVSLAARLLLLLLLLFFLDLATLLFLQIYSSLKFRGKVDKAWREKRNIINWFKNEGEGAKKSTEQKMTIHHSGEDYIHM